MRATVFSTFQNNGQQIKHLGAYDGIKSGAVRAFAKDTLGYMWIGTAQGLNRYSGYDFKSYNKYTTNSIVDISSKKGNLFVLGSKGELLQYQYQKDSFKSILNIKNSNFLCFEQINDNIIIIGLQHGLLIYDLKAKKSSRFYILKLILTDKFVSSKTKYTLPLQKELLFMSILKKQISY